MKPPVGLHAPQWSTMPTKRTVLVIVHTVTAANRLADVIGIFAADTRVDLVFTNPRASAIDAGVDKALASWNVTVIEWPDAVAAKFDLAISAHHSGSLHQIQAPLAVLSHGIGYTKHKTNPESRIPNPESRIPNPLSRNVYGLNYDQLTHEGSVHVDAILLSHESQRNQLADAAPDALDNAVLVGDPCYDRLLVSHGRRDDYRAALGITTETLITVTSTWGGQSLFATWPTIFTDLLGQLPLDSYRVAAILHPNVWYAHSPFRVRGWLADALRAGLILCPPEESWQQVLIASDRAIGDFGSVTGYAAGLGIPTWLGAFSNTEIAQGTVMSELGEKLPKLSKETLLTVTEPIAPPRISHLITSVPEQSMQRLRDTFYDLMDLPIPTNPLLIPPYATENLPTRVDVQAAVHVGATRYPVDAIHGLRPFPANGTLVMPASHPDRTLVGNAAVIIGSNPAELLRRHPAANTATDGTITLHRGEPSLDDIDLA